MNQEQKTNYFRFCGYQNSQRYVNSATMNPETEVRIIKYCTVNY